ncbi:MAG: hypothetical protein ACT4OE_02585 [Sphingosinicella sp.]
MTQRFPALAALLLLAACARSEDASLVNDVNQQLVEQVRTPEQDDQEIALGQWRDALQEEQAALEFGPSGAPPMFSLRCDARRIVALQRHGIAPAGDLPMMLVSVGSETRRLAVTGGSTPTPMLRASLAPSDPLVGTLNRAATPITIRIGDAPPLMLPPSPAIAGFLDRCAAGTAGAGQPGNTTEAPDSNTAATTNSARPTG